MKNKIIFISLIILSSCSASNVGNINKPKQKDIKKAMKHSSWEYKMPNLYN